MEKRRVAKGSSDSDDKARLEDGERCVIYLGPDSDGHFVKMVHNGIGYGIMASYVEGLNILRYGFGGHEEKAAAKGGA